MMNAARSKPASRTSGTENGSSGTEKNNDIENDPLGHLPDHEATILRKQIETRDAAKVTWLSLFRFASRRDIIIVAVSSFCAIAAGAAVPLNTVILGSLAGAFQDFSNGLPRAKFDARVNEQTLYFVYLAIGEC